MDVAETKSDAFGFGRADHVEIAAAGPDLNMTSVNFRDFPEQRTRPAQSKAEARRSGRPGE
jgi:hypothetical protein